MLTKVLDILKLLGRLHKFFEMIINNLKTWDCYKILTFEPSCTLI